MEVRCTLVSNQVSDGYTCPYCGTYVPYGTYHSCGCNDYNPCNNCPIFYKVDMLLEKLTRLIEVLEKKK